MKYSILAVSCINSTVGVIPREVRFNQTIQALKSYRTHFPKDTTIIFSDSSELPENWSNAIKNLVNYIILPSEVSLNYTKYGAKQEGETYQIYSGLQVLQQLPRCDYIFKCGARDILTDSFNLDEYKNYSNNFVFRKSMPSYINDGSRMIETTIWSFGYNLLDKALELVLSVAKDSFPNVEHAYYRYLDKSLLIEKDRLHMVRQYASSGEVHVV